ncbi:sulfite exporter TauE/SafE family protein [Catenovulum agarivorans]|uniref:sulfite exporter TauE/SafE family protein n=1 Tax=Catenovulum agarivorans TaxID=1172192 RepID=UPI000307410F|nr:sulfite exporter TauE/SafE family protein [Catenovulum agarivorans]
MSSKLKPNLAWLYPIALLSLVVFWLVSDKPLAAGELFAQYWTSALTMVFGSFVAGITPLGGGAVAFPVLTKVFAVNAIDAKYFSLTIQTIGMGFATLFFISRKVKIHWELLGYCFPAALIVLPFALSQTSLSAQWLRFAFSEFILVTAWVLWLCNHSLYARRHELKYKPLILFATAVLGSFLSASLGSGSDVVLFFVLVYVLKYPIKEAIPSTVVLMAFNAICASIWLVFIESIELSDFVINSWWTACIVAAIGAPLGAFMLTVLKEHTLRKLIYLVISLELLSTIFNQSLDIELRYLVAASSCVLLLAIAHKRFRSKPAKQK